MQQEQQNPAVYVLFTLLVIALAILGVIFYPKGEPIQPTAFVVLTPSPAVAGANADIKPEPVVTSWEKYTSDAYFFGIDYPKDWNKQEYIPTTPNSGMIVAFSPDSLPCQTCTYFQDGFFSVKIYNATTEPETYKLFQQRMKNAGKSAEYQKINLDKQVGVLSGNTASVENAGWVYEFSLDKNAGAMKPLDSQIFQRILTSVKFTNLILPY